ncbi:MAG: hypothetical protein RBR43_03475 [Desulfuromonadaceae bacterium]|nr:hypothetical protein [Desulfuromonas sp.]MDY0184927.1 hypothetical protein [Desulfuromonadaceae bacterium]
MSERLRILSLNMNGCTDMAFFYAYLSEINPDFVALQNTAHIFSEIPAAKLAQESNATGVNSGASHSMAFMSWKAPLKQVQEYDLGAGSNCMVADVTLGKERFLLFNVRLKGNFFQRPGQIKKLLSADLLGRYDMLLPSVIAGDFFDTLWVSGHPQFQSRLQRISPTFMRATYPARCPFISRDRFYVIGGIQVERIRIDNSALIRHKLTHLPLIMDMQVNTRGAALRVEIGAHEKLEQVLSGSSIFKCN